MERKDAIEVIKKNWPDSSFTMLREALETLIPELKESDDEGIRNEIIAFVEQAIHRGGGTPIPEEQEAKWIAWLEKQGKQKLVEKYNITGIGSKNAQGKLGEMIKNLKSADNVEPKFHEGDWVVYDGWICQIIDVTEDGYCNSQHGFIPKSREDSMRLWTIQDAKAGDVLAVEPENGYPSPFIAICKERGLDFFNSHCFVAFDSKFYVGENGHSTEDIHPATKEQRDTLERAITNAGYRWDKENLKLEKI